MEANNYICQAELQPVPKDVNQKFTNEARLSLEVLAFRIKETQT